MMKASKVYRDNLAIASGQRKLGHKEGFKEGMERRMEKGIEKEKREIARNLKSIGLSSEQIKQTTGLSLKDINNL